MAKKNTSLGKERGLMLGTGTWNDKNLRSLAPVGAGTKPSIVERKHETHLRQELTLADYRTAVDYFEATDVMSIAGLVRGMKTMEPSDVVLEKIASDLELIKGTEWTVSVYEDHSLKKGWQYFLEICR